MKHIKYTQYFALGFIGLLAFEASTNVRASEPITNSTNPSSEKVTTSSAKALLPWEFEESDPDPLSWRFIQSSVTYYKKSPIYGFRNSYANDIAFSTLRTGGSNYNKGAVFATYIYELNVDKGERHITPSKKIKSGFMTKDETAPETGGWVFTAFGADGVQRKIDQSQCFKACHAKAEDSGYILSKPVE